MISTYFGRALVLVGATLLFSAGAVTAQCAGDCEQNGEVTVDEILRSVNIALGNLQLEICPAADAGGDGEVTVEEIVQAVNNALNGCPPIPTPTDTPQSTDTPEPTATPTQPEPGCGNGLTEFELGETCDDGNTEDGDACPADCRIEPCTSGGETFTLNLSFQAPGGAEVAGLTSFLRYPDGVVRIPGFGNDIQVQNRLSNLPEGASVTPNDLDYALRLVLFTPDLTPIAPGLFATVTFDVCTAGDRLVATTTTPQLGEFTCTIESAADPNLDPVSGVSCSLEIVEEPTPTATEAEATPTPDTSTPTATPTEEEASSPTEGRSATPTVTHTPTHTPTPCMAGGEMHTFEVFYSASREATSLAIEVDYPEELVSLPGSRNEVSVRQRFTQLPMPGTNVINDMEVSVLVVSGGTVPKPFGRLFVATFDGCIGARVPTADDFACSPSCSDQNGMISGCVCTVVAP